MKRYEIITDADVSRLDAGETVALHAGGLITPLAKDSLKAKRITVIREDRLDAADEDLIPAAVIRTIAIGSDHSGLALKRALVSALRGRGFAVDDLGTRDTEPVDYPDTAGAVARAVSRGEADAGIVIDAVGMGSAIVANKVDGVRAAVCTDRTTARHAREYVGANVLSLGATVVGVDEAQAIVDTWLTTVIREPNDVRRLAKIRALEQHRR